ncbi:MAG: hypothetical protein HZB99_02100 [Candidatus Harrisonbacteria bacterium]|nr:hypothetical protein [Candidatus Harrisonbacteria bacterium]
MAKKPNLKKSLRKELRKLICKECQGEIDEVGCTNGCKYEKLLHDRDPETTEYHVYVMDRVEPCPRP